jgi:hypothetical protein
MCPSSTAPVSGWASSRAYNRQRRERHALLGAAPRQRSTYRARACKSTSVGRGRPPTPASAILKGGPASIRRCNVLGRIIKRQRVNVVCPTFCDVTSMQQSHAHEPMTNHQRNGRPLVLRECQELRREITTATPHARARTSLTEANTSVAACHDAVSQPAAAARGSIRAPVPLSSTIPSAKYSGAGSSLMFWNA